MSFSALHSKSGTNVAPKMQHLPSSSPSHGWTVEWIRICLPSGNCIPDPRLLKNSAKLLWSQWALGQVCCGLVLLYMSHLWPYRDKGLCHAVTHKDDTHFLLCFHTDPSGKKNLQEPLASKAAAPAHWTLSWSWRCWWFFDGVYILPPSNVLATALLTDYSGTVGEASMQEFSPLNYEFRK